MMHIKIFEYGYNYMEVQSFIEWWIKSGRFTRDIKKGDRVDGGRAIRDIDHTIKIIPNSIFEIIIERNIIINDYDGKEVRGLGKYEFYLNKKDLFCFGSTGFDKASKTIREWLYNMNECDPYIVNKRKALIEEQRFDMIGIGFFIETYKESEWKLRIYADVVGLPK
jgi:hypothetical protein